jgi:hypothetical protein
VNSKTCETKSINFHFFVVIQLFQSQSGVIREMVYIKSNKQRLGHKTMAQQLGHLEREKDKVISDLLVIVSNFKRRMIHVHEMIQKSNLSIDSAGKKVNENRSFVNKLNHSLDNTISSSTYSCKIYTLGLGIVFALWFFAYLVIRLFPKVK